MNDTWPFTRRARLQLLILSALLPGCSPDDSRGNTAFVGGVLDSTLAVHAQRFREGNVDSLVDDYSPRATVRPAGLEPLRGHAALKTALGAWISAAPIKALSYTSEDLAVFGDSAFQIVSYQATAQPPGASEVVDKGHCALFWVRDSDGIWKIDRSLCNSSMPPQQQVNRTTPR